MGFNSGFKGLKAVSAFDSQTVTLFKDSQKNRIG